MFDSGCSDEWGAEVHGGLQRRPDKRTTTGSVDAGRRWLAGQRGADSAYVAGYEWALWDYEDANGLSHQRDADTATG